MLRFYNMPGRLIAELEFLFPKRGQIWSTRRRRESLLAHFLFSTCFYAVLLVVLFVVVIASMAPRRAATSEPAPSAPTVDSGSAVRPVEDGRLAVSPVREPLAQEPLAAEKAPDLALSSSNSQASSFDRTPVAAPATFEPLTSQAVKDAIHAALSTGETQRWKDGNFSGYAVPGAPDARGCRMVRYSVDQRAQANAPTVTACDADGVNP